MSTFRRATMRAASASLAVASVFLLATCDLSTLTQPSSNTPGGGSTFDSTELVIGGGQSVTLAGTVAMSVTSSTVSLANVIKRYYSASPTIISVDSITGVATGVALGTAKVTAKILAPELGSGVTISQVDTVRYKGLKVTLPVATDSIQGLGQTRSVTFFGLNNSNVQVGSALTADSIRSRDTTVVRAVGTTLTAKKNGTSFVVAFFSGLRDSVAVRVRQVAKTITFPTTDYTARHVNFNLTVPLTVKDVADSIIPVPTLTWRTKDTTKAVIVASTGVLKVKSAGITDSVWAKMDTVERGQKIVVGQVPGSLTKFQGDARSDTVAKNVTVVPTVTVLDSGLTPIVGTSVVFKTGLGLNAVVVDTLPVTTDASGRAKPTSWKLGDVAGSNNNTLVATAGAQSTTFTVSGVAGVAKRLAFGVQPTSAAINTAINPAFTVRVVDSLGNTVTTAVNSITISLSNNPGGATLSGTQTAAAVAGVATFGGISLNASGSGYAMQAAAAGLQSGISNGFDIFGAKNKLGFTTQPATSTAGTVLPTVRVAIQDALGSTVTTATDSVAIAISANPGASTLTGTVKVAAVAGVATFSTLSLNNAGNGYTLQASSGVLTVAASNTFNMTAVGTPAKLAWSQQPTTVAAATNIAPSMTVRVLDANGALVATSTQQVTLSIDPASPSGGAISAGTTSQNAVGGVATFPGIQINKANTGYKLLATATGTTLTTATSAAFDVTPGTVTKVGFVQQPVNTTSGTVMPVSVTVDLEDASSNRVTTGNTVAVTLAIAGGTCSSGGTLSGAGPVNTVNGVATFSAVSLSGTATTSCQLTASASSLLSGLSTSFTSNAASAPARLKFTTQPTLSGTAGTSLANSGTVNIQDALGNNVTSPTSVSIVLSVASGPSTTISSCPLTLASTFSVSFANCVFNTAGSYKLVASATGYRTDTTQTIVIGPGAASKLGFLTQPTSATAGVPFGTAVQVAVQDAQGNTVTGATNVVTLSTQMQATPFTQGRFNNGSLGITATASGGIATFTGLAQRTSGVGFKMGVSATSLSGAASSLYDVSAAPVSQLGFVVQPQSNPVVSTSITPDVQVAGQDSVGNTITDFGSAITVAITGGTAGASLVGTKTVVPQGGISTFTSMSVDRVGSGYQLAASATGVTSASSNTFTVDPFFPFPCCTNSTRDLVVVGSTIYFTGGNALKSVPLAGGSVTTIVGSTNAAGITTDGTNVFWIERGTNNNNDAFVKKYTVASNTVSTLTVAQIALNRFDLYRLQTDGTNVYFAAQDISGTGMAIKSVSVNAVTATPTGLYGLGSLTDMYYVVNGGFIYFFDGSTIRRMTTTGASNTTLTTTGQNVQTMAIIGTDLYWNDGVNIKTIPNIATAGGAVTPTIAFAAPGTVYTMAANNGNLYLNANATLLRYSPSNFGAGGAQLANSPFQNSSSFQFTSTDVYFVDNTFARIARVPK